MMEKNNEEKSEDILGPFCYIMRNKGKQVRRTILKAFNNWLHIDDEKLNMIYDITDMLHNASLLIDDIEDNSELRRGLPVAHHIFGISATINAANLVYFLVFKRVLNSVSKDAVAEALKIFVSKFLDIHLGQGLEIYWRENFECPTELQYLNMIYQKTGGGFELCVLLMQLFSENKRDYSSLIKAIAEYYQIRDDYANLVSTEYENAKGYCDDLNEGKYSLPLIHAIQNNQVDQQFLDIIKKKPDSVELKRQIVDQLRACGSLDYTRDKIYQCKEMVRKEVLRFDGNEDLFELFNLLGDV